MEMAVISVTEDREQKTAGTMTPGRAVGIACARQSGDVSRGLDGCFARRHTIRSGHGIAPLLDLARSCTVH
jgi:hypothetical protein